VLLEATGCELDDVAQTNVYLADISLLPEVNEVYERHFSMPAPARTVVAVDGLPMGALIEMDCVACR
jgi:2-iminobutanoate/2-iminopropanoate deaminase